MAAAVAGAALLLARLLPGGPAPVLVAMLLGLLIGNAATLPSTLGPGLGIASKRALRLGVVLLGARLTVADVASIGGSALWVVAVCMAVAVLTVALLARLAGTPPRLATLIAVGTAVCGNTAIMATGAVDARGSALRAFPAFLFGFLALAGLRSVGILGERVAEVLGEASALLITVAIASVGLGTRFSGLRQVGLRPFLVGFGAAVALAVVGLAFARWLGVS